MRRSSQLKSDLCYRGLYINLSSLLCPTWCHMLTEKFVNSKDRIINTLFCSPRAYHCVFYFCHDYLAISHKASSG